MSTVERKARSMGKAGKHASWVWGVRLELLDLAVKDQFVLRELGRAIGAARRRIEEAPEAWRDEVVDDACEVAENMLGMGFIACQLDIIRLVSGCQKIHEYGPELGPKPTKQDLMERCERVGGLRLSKVTAIDAFANYFKHRDQWLEDWGKRWPADWSKARREVRSTAEIVLALGVVPGSSGNMRAGFEKIAGHTHYERVGELGEVVRRWASKVKADYARRMRARGLLKDDIKDL
jgi:hypothetical protein